MAFIIILIIIAVAFQTLHLPIYLSSLSLHAQNLCKELTPKSVFPDFYQAMVCGLPLQEQNLREIFQQTSLIHLIVVSGSHLIFFISLLHLATSFLKRWKPPHSLYWLVHICALLSYCFFTGFQPPVVRALLGLFIQWLNSSRRWHWTHCQQILITGLFTILLFPLWYNSFSLLLSWAASLAIAVSADFKIKNHLAKHTLIYIFIFPFLLPITTPHPASILFNLFLSGLLGMLLLPLTLLAFIFPPLVIFSDKLLLLLFSTLNLFSQEIELSPLAPSLHLNNLWIALMTLQLLIHLILILTRRYKCNLK